MPPPAACPARLLIFLDVIGDGGIFGGALGAAFGGWPNGLDGGFEGGFAMVMYPFRRNEGIDIPREVDSPSNLI